MDPPFLFNGWKHHLGFQREMINQIVRSPDPFDLLNRYLPFVGESQTDVYIGHYSWKELSDFFKAMLSEKALLRREDYKGWITNQEKNYRLIYLDDGSFWTFRYSDPDKRYIHIHPGRHSPETVRVRGLSLKTIFLIKVSAGVYEHSTFDLGRINQLREHYLNASPLFDLKSEEGVGKLLFSLFV